MYLPLRLVPLAYIARMQDLYKKMSQEPDSALVSIVNSTAPKGFLDSMLLLADPDSTHRWIIAGVILEERHPSGMKPLSQRLVWRRRRLSEFS